MTKRLILCLLMLAFSAINGQEVVTGHRRVGGGASSPATANPFLLGGNGSITTTAGNRLYIATMYMLGSAVVCTLNDSQLNTYTLLSTSSSLNPSFPQLRVYQTVPSASGTDALNFSTTPCWGIGVTVLGSGTHDVSSLNLVGGTPPSVTTTNTTTTANDVIFSIAVAQNGGSTISAPTQSGWTFLVGNGQMVLYTRPATTAGAYSATHNFTGGSAIIYTAMDSYKP
jgi:hypothetical protein